MKKIDINNHEVSPSNSYMFDTNIWLYIFGPIGGTNEKLQKKYSALYKDILSRKATLFITSLIVSEYINRVLRIGFAQWKLEDEMTRRNTDFKRDYRPTEHYKLTLEDAIGQMNLILADAQKMPDDFHVMNFTSISSKMSHNCDYNDAYILEFCEKVHCKLVSHDQDLLGIDSPLTLITAQ